MIAFLSLFAIGASLKNKFPLASVEATETKGIVNENATVDWFAEGADSSSDSSAASFSTKASLSEIKAKETVAPVSHDLDGKLDAVANQADSAPVTAASRASLARSQQWTDAERATSEPVGGSGLSWFIILAVIIAGGAFAATKMNNKEVFDDKAEPIAMSVSLGVKPRAAPAPLPNGITEVDVLETFDSYDKSRRGFIDSTVLEGLLGPDEAAQGDAQKTIGKVDKLFYHDFRKLVQQPGPVQNAVLNAASRKRGAAIELKPSA